MKNEYPEAVDEYSEATIGDSEVINGYPEGVDGYSEATNWYSEGIRGRKLLGEGRS